MSNPILSRIAFLLYILLVTTAVFAQPATSLPMEHWLTPVLERWAIAGWAPNLAVTEQPYSREAAAEAVYKVEEIAHSHGENLSSGDLSLLDDAKEELRAEIKVLKKRDEASGNIITNLVRRAKEFIGMDGGDEVNKLNYYVEPAAIYQHTKDVDTVNGYAAIKLGFAPVPSFVGVTGIRAFRYSTGYSYVQPHWDQVALQLNDTYLRFASGNFTVTYGNERRQIGVPGITSLILRGDAEPFPAFDIRFRNSKVTTRMIFGQLNNDGPGIQRTILLKRVEYHPEDWWGMGITDGTVISHTTGLDWIFLLPVPNIVGLGSQPVGTVTASERVGLDAFVRIEPRILLGGEGLISDFSHVDEKFRPTKSCGYRFSAIAIDPAGIGGGQVSLEYTRVLPFLYLGAGDTSLYGSNGTRWLNRNTLLGGDGVDYEQSALSYKQLLPYGLSAEIGAAYTYRTAFDKQEMTKYAALLVKLLTSNGNETDFHANVAWIVTHQWKVAIFTQQRFIDNSNFDNSVGLSANYFLHGIE